MKKSFIFIFAILILGFVSSIEFNFEEVNCQNILEFKGEIIGQEIPSQIPYSNEVFNVYISEEIFGSVSINNSIISELKCVENQKVTYNIYIENISILKEIFNSEEGAIDIFNEKISSEEIRIEGVGFGKKVKLFFTKIALKIASWFN